MMYFYLLLLLLLLLLLPSCFAVCMVYLYRLIVPYRIMPSCRWLLCFIVLMKMNDVNLELRRQNKNHTRIITR